MNELDQRILLDLSYSQVYELLHILHWTALDRMGCDSLYEEIVSQIEEADDDFYINITL